MGWGEKFMPKGKVKWFNDAKGYGFISQEKGPDVFVHYSKIDRPGYKSLTEDQEVEFEIDTGVTRGIAASVVRPISK